MKMFRKETMFTILKRFTLLLTLAGAFTLLAQLSSSAHAMCVVNYTDKVVSVEFICGFTCQNDWTLEPTTPATSSDGVRCHPGKGGGLNAGFYWNNSGGGQFTVILPVEANGWAELHTVNGDVQACSYRQDRSLSECQSYDPRNTVPPPSGL